MAPPAAAPEVAPPAPQLDATTVKQEFCQGKCYKCPDTGAKDIPQTQSTNQTVQNQTNYKNALLNNVLYNCLLPFVKGHTFVALVFFVFFKQNFQWNKKPHGWFRFFPNSFKYSWKNNPALKQSSFTHSSHNGGYCYLRDHATLALTQYVQFYMSASLLIIVYQAAFFLLFNC